MQEQKPAPNESEADSSEDQPAPSAMEEAQAESAEERKNERGYR